MKVFRMFVLVICLLLAGSAAVAEGPEVTLDLPEVTNQPNLQVTGQTVPHSEVTVDKYTTRADAEGRFTAELLLFEGENQVSVTVKTPDGQTLTWSGTIALDTMPPSMWVSGPTVTNVRYNLVIDGYVGEGASLQIDGAPVPVDEKGMFTYTIAEVNGTVSLEVVAVDRAGNVTRLRPTTTYDSSVPALVAAPFIGLTGYAQPGTRVSMYRRDGIGEADDTGLWQLLVPLQGGLNDLLLVFEPPSGDRYVHYHRVFQGAMIDLPRRTNVARLPVAGRILPDWTVELSGKRIPTDDEGWFYIWVELKPGANTLEFYTTSPTGVRSHFPHHVVRTGPLLNDVIDGVYHFEPTNWPEGTVFFYRDKEPMRYASDRPQVWRIPLEPGRNQLNLYYVKPSGEAGVYRYWFDHYPPGRYVSMTVGSAEAIIGGQRVTVPVPPQVIDGIGYVPLRFMAEALGADLHWDPTTSTATFRSGGRTVSMTLDSLEAKVDGQKRTMSAPPRLADGHMMVPLRFVSESLGARVKWDPWTQGILIMVGE